MKKQVWTLALLLCSSSLGLHAKAVAENQGTDTLKTVELQDVQVVSTRAHKTTPIAFATIRKEELQRINYGKDVPALLSATPSVTFSSDAGMGIGYTGIHVRGSDPTRINVTANGIPLNDAESSQLYWVNLGDLTSSMQSVQIQRGVGTSTNGAGAFGATINMQTEHVGGKPYASFDLSGGSYGTHKETFRFSTGLLGGHWGIQGRLSNISSDGYIDRASSQLNSYFLQAGYFDQSTMVKFVTFNGTEKTYMAWDYASKEDMEKYGRSYNPSGKYTDSHGNTAFYKNQTDNYQQQHYQLIWNQMLGRQWNLNTALHYTHGDGYYEQYKTSQKLYKYLLSSELGEKSDLIRQKKMKNDFYGMIASLNYDNKVLAANLGGGWNKYDGDHFGRVLWVRNFSGSINPDDLYYDNNAKKTDFNLYGKVNYEVIKGLHGFLDLQYRHLTYCMSGMSQEFDDSKQQRPLELDRSYNFFNPKFGITYQMGKQHTWYASYAIAHKEPTRNDFEDMMAEADGISPQAERLNDLEIGYQYNGKIWSAGANLYFMDYDNQFVLTGAQDSNGEMVARNIKDSYRLGVELWSQLKPFKGLVWDINATWSRNRARDISLTVLDDDWNMSYESVRDAHLAYSPDFMLNNIVSYAYKGFTASLTSKYVGEQYMTNSNFRAYTDINGNQVSAMIDSYFVSDLDLSYTFKLPSLKSLTVGVSVYNLFNEKYESHGSCSMNFKRENGELVAFGNWDFWSWSTYSAQAPTHVLAHLSLNF